MFYYGDLVDQDKTPLEDVARYMEMARWLHKDFKEALMGASIIKELKPKK